MLNVMEIERFALHDGPGIRTVVFLKGCALHCPWCANPESQSASPQLLYDTKKCVHCGACVAACPTGAAAWCNEHPLQNALPPHAAESAKNPKVQARVCIAHPADCTGCGACEAACLQNALTLCGTRKTAAEIAEVCLRDKDYYEASGGGVTLSGGEALLAGESLIPLLALLREQGVCVAVETCGQFSPAVLPALMPYFDLFLFDIKHADADKLKAFTGANAALIAHNLAQIVASGKRVVARVPVIPHFNHTTQEMDAIFTLCAANGVQEVNLLPYHTLGKGKYEKLGIAYPLQAPMLQKAELAAYVSLAVKHGIVATI